MTGILTRMNRIQDIAINWQEARYRRNENRQQQASLHRERMTCADTVRFDTQSQDWTGSMGISPSGRFQVIESAKPKKSIFSSEGLRWDVAWIVIIAVAVLCLGILLGNLAGGGMGDRALSKLDRKIADMTVKNEKLETEIALRNEDVSMYTQAVKMDLISSGGMQTIRLVAPEEAQLTISSVSWSGVND